MAIRISGKGEVLIAGADQTQVPFDRFDLDCSLAKSSFGFHPLIDL